MKYTMNNNNLIENLKRVGMSRRGFLQGVSGAGTVLGLAGLTGHAAATEAPKDSAGNVIPGFEKKREDPNAEKGWKPFSDRKVRVGIAGFGLCQFGAQFAQPRTARSGGVGAWETRRLRRDCRIWFVGGCRAVVRGGEEERPEIHDV